MSNFLSNLDFYCTEHLPFPQDEEYLNLTARRNELDRKIIQALGMDFLDEYTCLYGSITERDLNNHFREGLRFGIRFLCEISD